MIINDSSNIYKNTNVPMTFLNYLQSTDWAVKAKKEKKEIVRQFRASLLNIIHDASDSHIVVGISEFLWLNVFPSSFDYPGSSNFKLILT